MRRMPSSPEHQHKIRMPRRLFCYSSFVILLFASIPPARAQESSLAIAAAQMADALSHSKQNSIVVLDFAGPREQLTALGGSLADDFSAALTTAARNFEIVARPRVAEIAAKDSFTVRALLDPNSQWTLAQDLGATAFVVGSFEVNGSDLRITVQSWSAADNQQIANAEFSLPLTDVYKELMARGVQENLDPTIPLARSPGVGFPSCIYCPHPNYPIEAFKHKIQGTVFLQAVVELNGTVQEIRVVKALPYGLTEAAIKAVASWRLKPATGPDGNPTAVLQVIAVSFSQHPNQNVKRSSSIPRGRVWPLP
jgi:TonB family protein